MKTRIILFVGFLLLNFSLIESRGANTNTSSSPQSSITVYASPELYELTTNWVDQYTQVNQSVKINVVQTAGESWPGATSEDGLAFFADRDTQKIDSSESWSLVVGHDVIVPVMNAQNPLLEEINRVGISASGLLKLSGIQEKLSWQKLLSSPSNASAVSLHIYVMDDPDVISGVKRFLNSSSAIDGIKVLNQQEMISAIQRDPGALGFCKLTQIAGKDNRELADNIKLVPIDKNENGKIDFMEDIYSDLQSFSRGVWIGKYPKALAGNVYVVSTGKPQKESEIAFLKWVLTDGQLAMAVSGYRELVYNERQSQLNKISEPVTIAATHSETSRSVFKLIMLAIITFVFASFILDRIFRGVRNPRLTVPVPKSQFLSAFDENSVVVPKGVFFDKTHTWAFMKKNGLVTIGIDDFLQHVTGPITRIEMKNSGEKIKKGEVLFTIVQTGKQLSVYSPITGTVTANNKLLKSESSLLNSAPYTNGWVYLVEPLNWHLEVQFLFVAEKYKSWLSQEFIRLKDFLAHAIRVTSTEYNLVVMQDGGALKDCVLSGLGPEIWEDFQTEFINRGINQTL